MNYPPPPPLPAQFRVAPKLLPNPCTCFVRWDACPVHGMRHINKGDEVADAYAVEKIAQDAKKRINVRAKGQRGEREVVKLLQAVVDVVRTRRGLPSLLLQRNTLQSDKGGEDIAGLKGFAIEVKWQESMTPFNQWWNQCLRQAERCQGVPILFYRASHQPWKVKMRAFVLTPTDRDSVEMDMQISVEDFIEWFGDAYDASL